MTQGCEDPSSSAHPALDATAAANSDTTIGARLRSPATATATRKRTMFDLLGILLT
jgi:hypothetical protein